MAERPRAVEQGGDVIEKFEEMKDEKFRNSILKNVDDDDDFGYENSCGDSVKLFQDLCRKGEADEGIGECRKKRRCVDRYDSSESSDSGVAVLSSSSSSSSSTASSDITDPGSPFSTASSHSEEMPPAQTAAHRRPTWPWADDAAAAHEDDVVVVKRTSSAAAIVSKRLKKGGKGFKGVKLLPTTIDADSNVCKAPKMQQGKITEYFRSQCKSNTIKKSDVFKLNDTVISSSNCSSDKKISNSTSSKPPTLGKFVSVDQQTQFNSLKSSQSIIIRKDAKKAKKPSPSSMVPRKILPAPTTATIKDQLSMANFALTALSFPPNYAYLHHHHHQKTAAQKPSEPQPIFVLQPVQKIATINDFNCVKLNATVVPIVKVSATPSRVQQQQAQQPMRVSAIQPSQQQAQLASRVSVAQQPQQMIASLQIETAVPTVIAAKPRNLSDLSNFPPPPKQHCNTNSNINSCNNHSNTLQNVVVHTSSNQCRRTEESSSPHSVDDSDSGISNSLEVSVCEQIVEEQQKSPILSQPKTIRFPARQQERKEEAKPTPQQSLDGRCRWAECNSRFDTSGALLEHLQIKHVICQTTQEHFVCLWLGCKVHGRTSCSRSWLERHVLAHAGTKPFRCIVDGCGQRFNSQLMLERHVNGHFNSDGSPNNGSAKKTTDNNANKLYKRNGKRIRFRRQPWSARMFDFFDPGIMEGLQHNLLLLTQKRTLGQISAPGDTVQLQSQILAKRTETDGNVKFLLRWHPQDIIPDEWVSEKDYKPTKSASIPSLTASSKTALNPSLFSNFSMPLNGNGKNHQNQQRQKHRRKPIIKRT